MGKKCRRTSKDNCGYTVFLAQNSILSIQGKLLQQTGKALPILSTGTLAQDYPKQVLKVDNSCPSQMARGVLHLAASPLIGSRWRNRQRLLTQALFNPAAQKMTSVQVPLARVSQPVEMGLRGVKVLFSFLSLSLSLFVFVFLQSPPSTGVLSRPLDSALTWPSS